MAEFTLRQLQYFMAVVDEGSVTAAAKAQHISQAAVSMAVGQLEKSLGVGLFLRAQSKRMVPTPAGSDLARHARQILQLVDEVEDSVVGGYEDLRGPLRIGATLTVSPRVIPPLVEHFVRNHPLVDISVVEDSPAAVQEAVRGGRLDLALMYVMQTDPDLEAVEVADVRQHLVLPADHALAGAPEIFLGEVIGEPLILLDVPPTVERVLAIIRAHGLNPQLRWTSSSMETIRAMVARGLGYSFVNTVPRTNSTFDDLRVAYVPIADDIPDNPIVAVLPPGPRAARRVREAVEFLRRMREKDRSERSA